MPRKKSPRKKSPRKKSPRKKSPRKRSSLRKRRRSKRKSKRRRSKRRRSKRRRSKRRKYRAGSKRRKYRAGSKKRKLSGGRSGPVRLSSKLQALSFSPLGTFLSTEDKKRLMLTGKPLRDVHRVTDEVNQLENWDKLTHHNKLVPEDTGRQLKLVCDNNVNKTAFYSFYLQRIPMFTDRIELFAFLDREIEGIQPYGRTPPEFGPAYERAYGTIDIRTYPCTPWPPLGEYISIGCSVTYQQHPYINNENYITVTIQLPTSIMVHHPGSYSRINLGGESFMVDMKLEPKEPQSLCTIL